MNSKKQNFFGGTKITAAVFDSRERIRIESELIENVN